MESIIVFTTKMIVVIVALCLIYKLAKKEIENEKNDWGN